MFSATTENLECNHDIKMFSLSISKGLVAPHLLTERRKKRVQRNTSETGECFIRDVSAQERHADILKGLSVATITVMDGK